MNIPSTFLRLGVLLILTFGNIISSEAQVDYLKELKLNKKQDTLRVKTLLDLTDQYARSDMDSAWIYSEEALRLSYQLQYKRGIALAAKNCSAVLVFQGKTKEARQTIEKAMQYKDLSSINGQKDYANLCSNLVSVYREESNYKEAVEWGLKALKIRESVNDKPKLLKSYYNLGATFSELGVPEKAKYYFERQLALSKELKKPIAEAEALEALGALAYNANNLQLALTQLTAARKIFEQHGNEGDLLTLAINEGNVLESLGRKTEAIKSYLQAEKICLETDQKYTLPSIYINLSVSYRAIKNFEKAKEYAQKAQELAKANNSLKDNIDAQMCMIDALTNEEKYKEANHIFYKVQKLSDSLKNTESSQNLLELQVKYETERMEQANKLLGQENELNQIRLNQRMFAILAILLAAMLLGVLTFFWIRHRNLQAQTREVELEQKLLRMQMNPHFIFNVLQGLQQVVLQNNPMKADELLTAFARLMRQTLEQSTMSKISLALEIETLECYLRLQQNRFQEAWDYAIEVSEDLDTEQIQIPPMLLQPFVENAIEHGLSGVRQGGKITLRFTTETNGKEFWAEIIDNGLGRKTDPNYNIKHKSLSTQITKERLALLKGKTELQIIDLQNPVSHQPEGTAVRILLPITI